MKHTRRSWLQMVAAASALAADMPKKNMIVRSKRPEDLEMPLDGFSTWITPVERFFVRSHHYTPTVKLEDWKLLVGGEVEQQQTLTMEDLKRLPQAEVVAVLECAGNGRGLYEPPMPGIQWAYGGVGNARWTGVRLSEVLLKARLKGAATEVLFDGADVSVGTMPEFQRSVPLKKVLSPETILAYEMNGQPLPVAHGFPLRLVVPGWAGDSWTKWVTGIKVLDRPFDGFFMKTAYRHPGRPVAPGRAVDPAKMRPVESLSIKSLIASPAEGAKLTSGAVTLRGPAWSGETALRDVEVSTDRGRTWQKAKLGADKARYGWRLWEATFTPPQPGHYVLMARATDARGVAQPMVQEWNPSGYLHNVVHQVPVEVGDEAAGTSASGSEGAPMKSEPPPGYRTTCVTCHDEDIVMQQRLSRSQWNNEVDKMIRWGAKVNPQDRDPLIDYLLRLYGPRPRR